MSYQYLTLQTLVGKKVSKALFYNGQIYLETNDGIFKLSPKGDCCED